MTILCAHCNSDSRVVESRQRAFQGKKGRVNVNIVRLRECLRCRYRWKTVERTLTKMKLKVKEVAKCPSLALSNLIPTASTSSSE